MVRGGLLGGMASYMSPEVNFSLLQNGSLLPSLPLHITLASCNKGRNDYRVEMNLPPLLNQNQGQLPSASQRTAASGQCVTAGRSGPL